MYYTFGSVRLWYLSRFVWCGLYVTASLWIFGFLSVYLRKEEASSETLCILLVGIMEKVLKEVCEVSDIKPLPRIVMMHSRAVYAYKNTRRPTDTQLHRNGKAPKISIKRKI
jgi:hypothetical protein